MMEEQTQKPVSKPVDDVLASLCLKLFDWPLLATITISAVFLVFGRSDGPYPIGSPTFYANQFGPVTLFALAIYSGVRWLRRHTYTDRLLATDWSKRAILRRFVDLPGVAVIGYCVFLVLMVVFMIFGIVED